MYLSFLFSWFQLWLQHRPKVEQSLKNRMGLFLIFSYLLENCNEYITFQFLFYALDFGVGVVQALRSFCQIGFRGYK
jgi:hypothetical protein